MKMITDLNCFSINHRYAGISGDITMADKFMYIPNDDTQTTPSVS